MSWTEAVRQTENDWVSLLSRDGDLLVEALANLPPDAVARVQAVADFTVEVMAQQARGVAVIVDTGLGEAAWHISSSEDEDQPDALAMQPGLSQPKASPPWADQVDEPESTAQTAAAELQPVAATGAPGSSLDTQVLAHLQPQVPQPAVPAADPGQSRTAAAEVQPQQTPLPQPQTQQAPVQSWQLAPISKAKTKGDGRGPPVKEPAVKAMPAQATAVPAQTQTHPGQPPAKAPTVSQPPPLPAQPLLQTPQPTPDPPVAQTGTQQGTTGVQPVTGVLRPVHRVRPAPRLTERFRPDESCLSSFPNELVGYHSGIYYARFEAVGREGVLPQTRPCTGAFAPLSTACERRLPRELRAHGHSTNGFCLECCPE